MQAHAWVAAWPAAEARARAALQVNVRRLEASLATCGSVRWETGQAHGQLTPDSVLMQRPSGNGELAEASGGTLWTASEPLQGRAAGVAWEYGAKGADWEDASQRLVYARSDASDLAALGLASVRIVGTTRVLNNGLAALCAPTLYDQCLWLTSAM